VPADAPEIKSILQLRSGAELPAPLHPQSHFQIPKKFRINPWSRISYKLQRSPAGQNISQIYLLQYSMTLLHLPSPPVQETKDTSPYHLPPTIVANNNIPYQPSNSHNAMSHSISLLPVCARAVWRLDFRFHSQKRLCVTASALTLRLRLRRSASWPAHKHRMAISNRMATWAERLFVWNAPKSAMYLCTINSRFIQPNMDAYSVFCI
jgi:hypothetical protein